MTNNSGISQNSRRIAHNTVFLYFRMFLMMFIGLFTSRVVLSCLGVQDYGIWNAVGGLVGMFTLVSGALSNAISRFLAFEMGKQNEERLHTVFVSSVVVQFLLAILVVILVETLGMYFLHHGMNIPPERMNVAVWVLHGSAAILAVNIMALPYNALIVARENMKAFAYISLVEAVLKLSVALLLYLSKSDKLLSYTALMVAVALIVRGIYAVYCRRFPETRGSISIDRDILKDMVSFSGWNFLGTISTIFNTQGINLLSNVFFGVGVNAARGIAAQIEGMLRPFVNNISTAINPQITKSYAADSKEYCFHLVCRSSKYTLLLLLLVAIPFACEAPFLLKIWLGNVPDGAVLFTRLTLFAVVADVAGGSLAQLAMATGKVKKYYILIGGFSFIAFPLSWILFKMGFEPHVSYIVYIVVYTLLLFVKLGVLAPQTGLSRSFFLKETLLKVAYAVLPSAVLAPVVSLLLPEGWLRLIAVCVLSVALTCAFAYLFSFGDGEKEFIREKLRKK